MGKRNLIVRVAVSAVCLLGSAQAAIVFHQPLLALIGVGIAVALLLSLAWKKRRES